MLMNKKLKDIQQQIRRRHRINLLTDLRSGLLQSPQSIHKIQSSSQPNIVNEDLSFLGMHAQDMQLVDLVRAARYSQKQQNILHLKQLLFQQKIIKFMSEDYIHTDNQFYASFILSNLFCGSSNPPNQQLTYNLMNLLQNADELTIQNCLNLIENVVWDFPDWRDRVVAEHGLAQILYEISMAEHVSKRQLETLMRVVYRIVQQAKPSSSFKCLRKPLCHLILNLPIQDINLIKKAMNCLSLILCMFPEQTGKYIIKSTIINRLIGTFFQAQDKLFAFKSLNLIKSCLQNMPCQILNQKVMPLIAKLHQRSYEIGNVNSHVHKYDIQLQCYQIIYLALKLNLVQADKFYVSQLAKGMLNILDQNQNHLIAEQIFSIFVLVSTHNRKVIAEIKPMLVVANQRFPNNTSIISLLDYVNSFMQKQTPM